MRSVVEDHRCSNHNQDQASDQSNGSKYPRHMTVFLTLLIISIARGLCIWGKKMYYLSLNERLNTYAAIMTVLLFVEQQVQTVSW